MIYGTIAKCDIVEKLASMRDVLEIQKAITVAARRSLEKLGFLEITPPVTAPATDPGLRGAKHFEIDFYGKKYRLTGSMIMHKIAAASALRKTFALSPCIRKEKPESAKTGRHLVEFWQIDVEMLGTKEEAMKTAETLLRDVIEEVSASKKSELERLGRKLRVPELPLKRITHAEAIELGRRLGFKLKDDEEIPWDAEKAISKEIGEPFFVMDYSDGSRGFYDKTFGDKQLSFDLIYPDGFGEALSGSERESDAEAIRKKLIQVGQEPEEYGWFIDIVADKKVKQTAGFGFGLERMTRYICGLDKIEEATPFPKLPGGDGI